MASRGVLDWSHTKGKKLNIIKTSTEENVMFSIWINLDLDKWLIYLAFISTILSKSD